MVAASRRVCLIAFCVSVLAWAQADIFSGTWESPQWKLGQRGIVVRISSEAKTIHFFDPHSDHESLIHNFKTEGDTATFDVEDEYVGQRITFRMTVDKRGSALLKGFTRESSFDVPLVNKSKR